MEQQGRVVQTVVTTETTTNHDDYLERGCEILDIATSIATLFALGTMVFMLVRCKPDRKENKKA